MAAFSGQVAAAQILLDHGANASAEDAQRTTPLHLATSRGSADMVQMLLAAGASVSVEDFQGRTPPLIASLAGHERLRSLMLAGVAPDSPWARAARSECSEGDELSGTLLGRACMQHAVHQCRAELPRSLLEARHVSSLFFDAATERALAQLTFLTTLTPSSDEEFLARHGLEAVMRFVDDNDDAGEAALRPPRFTHATSPENGVSSLERCPTAPSAVQVGGSDLMLLRTHNASATFDGFVYTADGAVLSSSPTMTKRLQREIIASGLRSGVYRLSRSCPSTSACCVAAGSDAAAQLTLWPLLLGLANHQKSSDDGLFFDSFFGDACGSSEALERCTGLDLSPTAAHRPPAIETIADGASILVWQPPFSDNFGHFLAEALPRLLRLESWLVAHPDCLLFFAGDRPFSRTILTDALGLQARVLAFHPCTVYHASTVYLAVATGRRLAFAPGAAHTSELALPTPAQTYDMRRAMLRLVPPPHHDASGISGRPYVLFVDRSDAPTRANPGDRAAAALRRADLTNMDEAYEAVEAALARHGVELRRFRAGSMTLASQVESLASAAGLIGTHAAGITSAFVLPDKAFLVEIAPAREPFENWMSSEDMKSQCGYSMFWYLAEARGLRYHALLLPKFAFEDVLTVPANQLAVVVEDMVSWSQRGTVQTASSPPHRMASSLVNSLPIGAATLRLHDAVADQKAWLVPQLVERGANASSVMDNATGETPLHRAAADGAADVGSALLAIGAPSAVRDRSGRTPLHVAAAQSQAPMVALLCAAGATSTARDRDGNTPLHEARSGAVAKELLRCGRQAALLLALNERNASAMHVAAQAGRAEVLSVLAEHIPSPAVSPGEAPAWLAWDGRALHETPLLLAARHGHVAAAFVLMRHMFCVPAAGGAIACPAMRKPAAQRELAQALAAAEASGSADVVDLLRRSSGQRRDSPAASKQAEAAQQLAVDTTGQSTPVRPPAPLTGALSEVALVTARFYPPTKPRTTLECPPHPHAFVITNIETQHYPEEPCWRHVVVPLECKDAGTCSMAAKAAKMPLAAPAGEVALALSRFSLVLYFDDKFSFDSAAAIEGLVAQLPREAGLLLLAHHDEPVGHRGVDAELRAALRQPRYRKHEAEIRAFMVDEHAHVPRHGRLHATGLLLWNMTSDSAKKISRFWYDATSRTSSECQITFYYCHQRWSDSIATVPFEQPGVQYQLTDTWGQYGAKGGAAAAARLASAAVDARR